MTDTISQTRQLRCGNCDAQVDPSAVTCPACGVLLAAYQAPAGATTPFDVSTPDTPVSVSAAPPPIPDSPIAPAPWASPPRSGVRRAPRSRSPIDDALRGVRNEDVEAAALETSAAAANELAQMAADDSRLAREVEAELAGAKVTFDGSTPVIVADHTATDSPPPRPVVAEPPAAAAKVPVATPTPRPRRPAQTTAPQVAPGQPARQQAYSRPAASPSTATGSPAPQVRPQATKPTNWVAIIVIVMIFLGIGRSSSSIGAIVALVLGVGVVILVMRMAAAMSGRKTTSMPWDDTWNKSGRK